MTVRRLLGFVAVALTVAGPARAADFCAGLMVGYSGALGGRATFTVNDFARGFPLGLEAGVGYFRLDPGNPAAARKVFINDATDGTPEESGSVWDFRLDFQYKVGLLKLQDAYAYVGVRHSRFTGNFAFIGGNEDFDVTSNQWGLGAGMKASFPMGARVNFVLGAGLDYFFNATLSGHDTSYSPNGETVNGRNDYTYQTADDAISQPRFAPVAMLGVSFGF